MKYEVVIECRNCGEKIGMTQKQFSQILLVTGDKAGSLVITDHINFFNCKCRRKNEQQDFIAATPTHRYKKGKYKASEIRPLSKDEKERLIIESL